MNLPTICLDNGLSSAKPEFTMAKDIPSSTHPLLPTTSRHSSKHRMKKSTFPDRSSLQTSGCSSTSSGFMAPTGRCGAQEVFEFCGLLDTSCVSSFVRCAHAPPELAASSNPDIPTTAASQLLQASLQEGNQASQSAADNHPSLCSNPSTSQHFNKDSAWNRNEDYDEGYLDNIWEDTQRIQEQLRCDIARRRHQLGHAKDSPPKDPHPQEASPSPSNHHSYQSSTVRTKPPRLLSNNNEKDQMAREKKRMLSMWCRDEEQKAKDDTISRWIEGCSKHPIEC